MDASLDINEVIYQAASASLPEGLLKRVQVEDFLNSLGEAALRVTIVLDEDPAGLVNGDRAVDTILKVSDELWLAGETRPSMLVFATEEELAHSGDPDL